MRSDLRQISKTLKALDIGQRFWWWYGPGVPICDARLLITTFSADPTQAQLEQLIEAAGNPVGCVWYRGTGTVDSRGRLRLAGVGLSAGLLRDLAAWVSRNAYGKFVPLGRLRDVQLLKITPHGEVVDRLSEADWSGVARFPAPGSPEVNGALLEGLADGEQALAWLTEAADDGEPALAVTREDADPDAARLLQRIRGLGSQGGSVKGVFRRISVGKLGFSTPDDPTLVERILTVLVEAHPRALRRLRNVTVFHVSEAGFSEVHPVEGGPDLSELEAILTDLSLGDHALFSFTDHFGPKAEPMLFLQRGRDGLKEASAAAREQGREIRGALRISAKGVPIFVSRRPFEDFLPLLAGFVAAHRGSWPGLNRLLGARLLVQDPSGKPIARVRDDAVWHALPSQPL